MKKLCALLRIKLFSQPDDTKIVRRFDFMAVFLSQCHFQDLPFYLKSHNLHTENFPLFGFPG